MRVDERIVSVEKLERAGTVLVDAHSLYQLADELIERHVPAFGASILTERGGPRLANVIQNIVLYDRVVVDSLLFQVDSKISTAASSSLMSFEASTCAMMSGSGSAAS